MSKVTKNKSLNVVQLNELQQLAYDSVLDGKNIFITGSGGSGKSYLVNYIKHSLESKYYINTAITSLTGISANLIGGSTIHSYLGLGLGTASYKKLLKGILDNNKILARWKRVSVLIIDEVSMMTIELFEKIERLARNIRKNPLPFGGIQIVMSGDFLQLPPVGQTDFIFESSIWDKVIHKIIYLTVIIRQKDSAFTQVLNKIRICEIDDEVSCLLKSREIKYRSDTDILPTMLYSTNAKVDATNDYYYNQLESKEHIFHISYKWWKNIVYKEKYDTVVKFVPELTLKVGSQVMHLINLPDGSLFNGSRGVIKEFIEGAPLVLWHNKTTSLVSVATLDIEEQDDKVMSYTQIPLKLSWAISIHKSQGCTLDLVRLNFARMFENGQAYVALSRVRSLNALYIRNLDLNLIKANSKGIKFYKDLENNSKKE